MKIQGEKVGLIPIALKDKDEFFELATKSYGSLFWYDETEKQKKSKKAFFKEWTEGYFNTRKPYVGQCFWIIAESKKIGMLCYNEIDKQNKKTELDIIIGDKECLGKGYGADALKILIKYLFKNFDLNKIWLDVRSNNPRAIKAYQKVGFKKEGLLREENYFRGKFVDCIRFGVLRKEVVK